MNAAQKSKIRAVFLDLDGTVYSHRTDGIPTSADHAAAALREKGILVFIATGRHVQELKWMHLDDYPADGWITVNGAYCYNNKGTYYSEPIDRGDIRILCEALQEDPFPCMFLEAEKIFINIDDERVRKSQESIHTPMPETGSLEKALSNDIYMLVPYAEEEKWQPVRSRMRHVTDTRWTDLAVDVFSDQCGKDRGISETLRHYGLKKEEVLGVGDGPNDAALLQACGYRAAMGNAVEELKKLADFVSTDIDEDGLKNVFVHYGLLEE